jgi:hypothetical protein
MVPNTAPILQITPSELWYRTYSVYLQHSIFMLQSSTERICNAIGDITKIQIRVILQTGYHILHTSFSLRYVNSAPGHIQCSCSSAYTGSNNQLNVSALLLQISRKIRRALYRKFGAEYRAHPLLYAMWTVVPDICSVITAPHIQVSIFNWTHRRCYWRYLENAMRVLLQTWCQISRTSSSLRNLNCGPDHIQYNNSST